MLDSAVTLEKETDSVPRTLLYAKKEAVKQASGKGESWNKSWEKGPWDKGHWANRK